MYIMYITSLSPFPCPLTPYPSLPLPLPSRIFRLLGPPSPKTWPDLEHLPHWHDNTENVRVRKPEWGGNLLESTLQEAMRAALPQYMKLCGLQARQQA